MKAGTSPANSCSSAVCAATLCLTAVERKLRIRQKILNLSKLSAAPAVSRDLSDLPETETARDLLLNLGHPQVALPLIVGEGGGGNLEKAQHIVLLRSEALQQVARLGALAPSPASRVAALPAGGTRHPLLLSRLDLPWTGVDRQGASDGPITGREGVSAPASGARLQRPGFGRRACRYPEPVRYGCRPRRRPG